MENDLLVLEHKVDDYDGIQIDETQLPGDILTFGDALKRSLEAWTQQGRCGAWLRVPKDRLELVSVAQELGMSVHHARSGYVMMTAWLRAGASRLPEYAHHTVGVGCFVSDGERVLVVQEATGPLRGRDIWKLPGGMVDRGEELPQAAERECLEETGVRAKFHSVLGFRQHLHGLHDQSDLYFLVRLDPPADAELRAQAEEIAKLQWMPLDDFASLPYYRGVYKELIQLGIRNVRGDYHGLVHARHPVVFRPGDNIVYHGRL